MPKQAEPTAPKLTAAQARKLLRLEQEVASARRQLESLEKTRREVRKSLGDRVPFTGTVEVGGVRVRRRRKHTGRSFRLAAFLDAGNKVTKAMAPFVGPPTPYEAWSVTELTGS